MVGAGGLDSGLAQSSSGVASFPATAPARRRGVAHRHRVRVGVHHGADAPGGRRGRDAAATAATIETIVTIQTTTATKKDKSKILKKL